MRNRSLVLVSALAASLLTACSGGASGGTPVTVPTNAPQPPTSKDPYGYISTSVGAVNSLGAPVQGSNDQNETALTGGSSTSSKTASVTLGQCTVQGSTATILLDPDKNGDANSTEMTRYQDTTCTQPWVDTVRVWAINGTSETVNRTISKWAPGDTTTPSVIRQEAANYTNVMSFSQYGYPVITGGVTRTATSTVTVNGSVVTNTADEFVAGGTVPNNPNQSVYCGDTTGYDVTGDPILAESFAWASETNPANGLRTDEGNGLIDYNSTRTGSAYTGPIGFLKILTNKANINCPQGGITTPMFSAVTSGGYVQLPFSLPIDMQFQTGYVKSITISNGTLANGYVLNVKTTDSPAKSDFLTGFINSGSATGTQIGTFTLNANGFGTLTIINGVQYKITDWHIVT